MSLNIHSLKDFEHKKWDEFCQSSHQTSFLFTRCFLSYHGDRFQDMSIIIEEDGKWVGAFPAAQHPNQPLHVVSHPGITYGGVLHQGKLKGERMLHALSYIIEHYRSQGFNKLTYKALPWLYHVPPAQDDLYALFRLGATLVRRDLSSTIDLQYRLPLTTRRKRSLKKAITAKIEVRSGNEFLPSLWEVLTNNLQRKHQTAPVHSLSEITILAKRFPNNIRCIVGQLAEKVVAGVLLFSTPAVDHTQYIASSEEGYDVAALDAIFEHAIETAKTSGKRWFDFGISTENSGQYLNESLYRFKSEFGGGGIVHDFYELNLTSAQNVG